jgi:hypothetical protein
VESLSAGDELEAAKDQIEAIRVLRTSGLRVCVERALDHRVADDEEEVGAVLAQGPVAEPALVCRGEVGLADDLPARRFLEQLQCVGEVQIRNLCRYVRQVQFEQLHGRRAVANTFDHARYRFADDPHHGEVVFDEPELCVERYVLGEVATGVMRLGAKNGAGLENALEHTNHRLLVELRALSEVGGLSEVVEREDVRAALSGGGDDLRRLDLCEAQGLERPAKAADRAGRQLERRPLARMPKGDRRVVEDRRQLLLQPGTTQLDRRSLSCRDKHADLGLVHLHAAGCLRRGYDRAHHLQH